MTQTIRAHWHRLRELVREKEVYFTAPPGGDGQATLVSNYGNVDWNLLNSLLDELERLPYFVIDRELMELSNEAEHRQTLWDMREAGVLHLPYPAMIVEYTSPRAKFATRDNVHISLLRERGREDETVTWDKEWKSDLPFYGVTFIIYEDAEGGYVVMSPSFVGIGLTVADDGEQKIAFTGADVAFVRQPREALAVLARQTQRKDMAEVFITFCGAMIMMGALGTRREVIDCEKLNRRRAASGKPAIPRHTYITIGRVYRSASDTTGEAYVPRRSPRPHMRRGHNRRIIEPGTHREGRVWKFFPAKLVAFAADANIDPPTYEVHR